MKILNIKLNDTKTKFVVHMRIFYTTGLRPQVKKIIVFSKNSYEAEKEAKQIVAQWRNFKSSKILLTEDVANHRSL
jgi:hypothetical protein